MGVEKREEMELYDRFVFLVNKKKKIVRVIAAKVRTDCIQCPTNLTMP